MKIAAAADSPGTSAGRGKAMRNRGRRIRETVHGGSRPFPARGPVHQALHKGFRETRGSPGEELRGNSHPGDAMHERGKA